MIDIVERLRMMDWVPTQWSEEAIALTPMCEDAADEIEALRQRVKELEDDKRIAWDAWANEVAAMKAGQGEPVCYLREEWMQYEQSAEGQPGAFPVYAKGQA